ncbi:MAG: hypothetical protein ACRESU_03675 [Gammaproteobacteria bacterium]
MHKFVSAFGLLTLLVLSGCATTPCGNPHPYTSDTVGAPLKAPAGMSVPAPDPTYAIPAEKPAAKPADDAAGACLAVPPQLITPQSSENNVKPAPGSGTQTAPAPVDKPVPGTQDITPTAGTIAPPAVASGVPIG